MQKLRRKKQMTLLLQQNRSMISRALQSPAVCHLRKTAKQKLVDIQAVDLQLVSIQQQSRDKWYISSHWTYVDKVHSADNDCALNIVKSTVLGVANLSWSNYWTCWTMGSMDYINTTQAIAIGRIYCNVVMPITNWLCAHFWHHATHVCEWNVTWKVLENDFVESGKSWNLVFAIPGKSWKMGFECLLSDRR